jgi:phage shock protein C
MERSMQDVNSLVSETEFANEPDSLFGVCQAIGEDLGFDPFYLRIALLGLLFFSPLAVIGVYLALGGTVALSRWLFPKPAQTASFSAEPAVARTELPTPSKADADAGLERELVAA